MYSLKVESIPVARPTLTAAADLATLELGDFFDFEEDRLASESAQFDEAASVRDMSRSPGLPAIGNSDLATLDVMQWPTRGLQVYTVRAEGHVVARRTDNSWVNGTKMLNVAGFTRGKRDGILKNELEKEIVRSGPFYCVGVWIPLQRAKALASTYGLATKFRELLSDFPSLYLAGNPWTPKQGSGRRLSASSIATVSEDAMTPTHNVDQDVAKALAEFRSLDRRSAPVVVPRLPTPPALRQQQQVQQQLKPDTPVFYAPFLKPPGLDEGLIPPYIWLAVPSAQAGSISQAFGSDGTLQKAQTLNLDLTKLPIYSIVDQPPQP